MQNSLLINHETNIYVACPANVATGGPELLHQLVFELNNMGINAYMYYYDLIENQSPIHEAYAKYKNKYVIDIDDSNKNYLIVPEVIFAIALLKKYVHINKIIWWLSVDNHFLPIYTTNKKYFFIQRVVNKFLNNEKYNIERLALNKFNHSNKKVSKKILKDVKYHFYQSYYAEAFLKSNRISSENLFYLSDYLNQDFLTIQTDYSLKENIVVYNPKKGYEFTRELIEQAKHIKFIAIQNMTRDEVVSLLQKAKVYIDFGNHPGKDRIPREAAILGCCIITNRQGSANFSADVPIPKTYKFEEKPENISDILKKIDYCFANFTSSVAEFTQYRKLIKNEPKIFIEDIKNIFSLRI